MGDKFELTVDQDALKTVGAALKAEDDGKALRRDLLAELKTAVAPGASRIQGKLKSIPRSRAPSSPSMGSYLASRVKPAVKLSGRTTGVKVRIGKTPGLRGFATASRMLNRGSWRHPVMGSKTWITQQSAIPGYFDDTMREGKTQYREAVVEALEKMAHRIAQRVKSA